MSLPLSRICAILQPSSDTMCNSNSNSSSYNSNNGDNANVNKSNNFSSSSSSSNNISRAIPAYNSHR